MQRRLQILLTCLLLVTSVRGLTAPPSTVVTVKVGADGVLPCHLGPDVNSSTLRMECFRSDLSPGFIFVWVEGRERLEHKLQSYLQRTSVRFSGMKLGDVSLQLTNVTALDEGTYICRAPRLRQSCSVQLLASSRRLLYGETSGIHCSGVPARRKASQKRHDTGRSVRC